MNEHPSAEFRVTVYPSGDFDSAEVRVECSEDEPPFVYWMAMTEYLLHLTAQKSDAGYEAALDLLRKGAMDWLPASGRAG